MARAATYDKLIARHLKILTGLQYSSGLFAASKKGKNEGYDKAWLRDNFYECLAFEALEDFDTVQRTYRAVLDIFRKHEYKLDHAIEKKPEHVHQFIHARYHPETFEEYWDEWGNKQNDSVGCILYKLGELEELKAGFIVEDDDDRAVVQKLVRYLETLEYWHDADSGMWEENQEVHASSVGACVAGLKKARHIEGVVVPDELIRRGEEALMQLLPNESETKPVDLALLSLIWPYEVTTPEQTRMIIANVEHYLLRERGVIRYEGDVYFNENPDEDAGEAEWTFGLSWLAVIYAKLGEKEEAKKYLEKAKAVDTKKGMPELYYAGSDRYNENTPLGWSESLFIVALHELGGQK